MKEMQLLVIIQLTPSSLSINAIYTVGMCFYKLTTMFHLQNMNQRVAEDWIKVEGLRKEDTSDVCGKISSGTPYLWIRG